MAVQNGINNVYNLLLEQLENISDPSTTGDELDEAIKRAAASEKLAGNIINIARLSLDAAKLQCEYGNEALPEQFRIEHNGDRK